MADGGEADRAGLGDGTGRGDGGFTATGEAVAWSGHHLTVRRASFVSPDGQAFDREVMRSGSAVAAVPLLDDGDTVILVSQFRAALGRYMLEIPAGMRDVEGEDPIDCVRRELVEEIGRQPGNLEPLLHSHVAVGFTDHAVTIYLATDLVEVGRDVQGPEEEHMTIETVSLAAAPELIARGTITDAKTIMGLLVARERLRAAP